MMNVLLLYNKFDGANGSFQVFQDEIVEAVSKYDKVYVSYDVSDTLRICKEINIDFSIGIGMFNQYINKRPIYDVVKVRHYQWVIDSPLKMDLDTESNGVTYICINKDFSFAMGNVKNTPLFLPLGYKGDSNRRPIIKKRGIVFCGQIKDEKIAYESLNSTCKKLVSMFMEEYRDNLDSSFEKMFFSYFSKVPLETQKQLFRPLNSYFRALKRKLVISSIEEYPVYILGEAFDKDISSQKNVQLLGKYDYSETWNIVSEYEFSLNIDPNYYNAIHDRVIRSISYGTIPVTVENNWCKCALGESAIYYRFNDLMKIESQLESCEGTDYVERLQELQIREKVFLWENIMKQIKEHVRYGISY